MGGGAICSMRHGGTPDATLTERIDRIGHLLDCRRGGGGRRDMTRTIEERRTPGQQKEDMRGRFGHEAPTLRELGEGFEAMQVRFLF